MPARPTDQPASSRVVKNGAGARRTKAAAPPRIVILEPAPVIDGLSGVQRVFYGWAQVWRTKSRAAEAIRRLAVDPHSPPEFRCNGVVRNVDVFYEAFDVAEDDALFLAPQRRVRIWN